MQCCRYSRLRRICIHSKQRIPVRSEESILQTNRRSRRAGALQRPPLFLLRRLSDRKLRSSVVVDLDVDLVVFSTQERALFDADALHVFDYADRVSAMNQNDPVTGTENNFAKHTAVLVKKLYRYHATLHDKHLLQIADYSIDWLVVVRWFDEAGFMSQ